MTRVLEGLAAGLMALGLIACDVATEEPETRDLDQTAIAAASGISGSAGESVRNKGGYGNAESSTLAGPSRQAGKSATAAALQPGTNSLSPPVLKIAADARKLADPFLWLEEIDGTKALLWVLEHNRNTRSVLEGDARFAPFKEQSLALLTAPDRIPYGSYRDGYVYNFWQDETRVRGVFRRATIESYRSGTPEWEILLDVDKLAATEGENWVMSGIDCLPPEFEHCMVALSRGGKDKYVLREWNAKKREFVEDGFRIGESYAAVDWFDKDTLLISSPHGRSLFRAFVFGFRHNVRKWKRGTPVGDAEPVYEGKRDDLGLAMSVLHRPEGRLILVARRHNFYDRTYVVVTEDGTSTELPVPRHAVIQTLFKGQALFVLRKDWPLPGQGGKSRTLPQGALISFDLDAFLKTGKRPDVRLIHEPGKRSTIQSVTTTRDAVLLGLLNNVVSELRILRLKDGQWDSRPVPIPENGTATVVSTNDENNLAFVAFEDYLTPDSLYELDAGTGELNLLQSLPPRFDAEGLTVQRFEATSKDGTKVPWSFVGPAGAKRDGKLPVLLYGYGGFGITFTPRYWAEIGKLWLEKGGGFVVANIRGGGAFGPDWHQSALRTGRQRHFDDFIAVAEDLIERRITSPRHLGIMGGSNGGLLVGVAFTQRPDLYNAVVCLVPLLDMIRYTKLGPGRVWISEYGDPSKPRERAVLLGYSPYHNLKAEADYPKVFFLTSTNDDRVHPGHARKMAARMEELGHDIHYYEYFEGGHSAGANLHQRADIMAMQFVYLARQLMDEEAETAQPKDRNPSGDTGN